MKLKPEHKKLTDLTMDETEFEQELEKILHTPTSKVSQKQSIKKNKKRHRGAIGRHEGLLGSR